MHDYHFLCICLKDVKNPVVVGLWWVGVLNKGSWCLNLSITQYDFPKSLDISSSPPSYAEYMQNIVGVDIANFSWQCLFCVLCPASIFFQLYSRFLIWAVTEASMLCCTETNIERSSKEVARENMSTIYWKIMLSFMWDVQRTALISEHFSVVYWHIGMIQGTNIYFPFVNRPKNIQI